MFYTCDNCENTFSDNDTDHRVVDNPDGSVSYYCCSECEGE